MPFVSALLCAQPSVQTTARAVAELTALTANVLRKERTRTTVAVQYVPITQWGRGGLPARGFFIETRITAGTTTPADKARYIEEVNRALRALLDGAPGYVAVSEIPADSWGHDGETQEARYSGTRALA